MQRFARSAPLFVRSSRQTPLPTSLPYISLQPEASTSRFPTSFVRSISPFSTSAVGHASEAPQSPFEAPYAQAAVPLYDRLQAHPEALQAIQALSMILKEKTGVDLAGGEKPNMAMSQSIISLKQARTSAHEPTLSVMKLAQDPELRTAAENLMKALSGAGIQIDPQQALQALKTMGDGEFDALEVDPDLPNKLKGSKGNGEGENGGKA
ncbi:hypothetical protein P7C70_g2900, partial [Phenoliferia sp. Uapishka_3]